MEMNNIGFLLARKLGSIQGKRRADFSISRGAEKYGR
jgi:hypothetical protein